MLIFERSVSGRIANAQTPRTHASLEVPEALARRKPAGLPAMSELDVVRHYTSLSRKNFSIATHFYPLGSCTMKYNPIGAHHLALLKGFSKHHPMALPQLSQGVMSCMYELQDMLAELTGMHSVSLSPMAGAQGELVGVAMIKAYHESREDYGRFEVLVPDAAHGTNPASVVMCGYKVREIPTTAEGDVDIDALKAAVGPQTAGIMLTNPSTLGVFERKIQEIAKIVHGVGGLLYYDGANLNAILGRVRPGDMGFDVMHLNLHKTFATPHGAGGPGAGPVAVSELLAPFLPVPRVACNNNQYEWLTTRECPRSIGRLSTFMGNVGVLLRAYIYIRMLGREGVRRVSSFATLNANYLMARLKKAGVQLAFDNRRASHEFVITFKELNREVGVSAMDIAKRLLDYGYHAPTTYFPLLVPECFLIEPTETESKQTIDDFVEALLKIIEEAKQDPDFIKNAPHTMPVKRLDDVKAAKQLDLIWTGDRNP